MTPRTDSTSLVERVRLARLPTPATRRRIRERAGVSIRDMAAELDVHPMTLWHWEQGDINPRMENAMRYRCLLDQLDEAVTR